jgi:hypothetical protein
MQIVIHCWSFSSYNSHAYDIGLSIRVVELGAWTDALSWLSSWLSRDGKTSLAIANSSSWHPVHLSCMFLSPSPTLYPTEVARTLGHAIASKRSSKDNNMRAGTACERWLHFLTFLLPPYRCHIWSSSMRASSS